MADEALLHILKQGVDTWNEWVNAHPDVAVDLSFADLRSAKLKGALLSKADLSAAKLSNIDLSGADLRWAILSAAELICADISGANLYRADLPLADLSDANLSEANLTVTDFRRVDFNRTNLSGADLRGAFLSGSVLSTADMRGADLTGVNLSYANLYGANLGGARLHNAQLYCTNFCSANLKGADFKGAFIGDTVFADNDLSGAIALEEADFHGPSEVDFNTIYRSKGHIPETFLRGCGLPESLIVQIPALVGAVQPIQFHSCFISYSGKDEELAQRLYADLQNKGVRCWFAPEDLKIGERFRRRIDEVIRVHDKLLLILSEHSVGSSWVEKEVETALESEDEQKRTVLFPVRLDDSVIEVKTGWPADVRRTRHIGDFRRWKEHDEYQKAFARLLADLKASA